MIMKHNRLPIRAAAAVLAAALLAVSAAGCGMDRVQGFNLSVPDRISFDNQPNATVLAYDEVSTTYYRDSLNETEQKVYDLMKLALSNPQKPTSADLGVSEELEQDVMTYISECVWIDNPVFAQTQTNAIEYSFNGSVLTLTLKQSIDEYEAHMDRAEQALDKAREIAAEVDQNWTDYEKVKYLHDTIAKSCFYSVETKDTNNEAYGVLVLGESMCEGYTDAMMMLCLLAGIDSTATWFDGAVQDSGETINGHVWNVVQMDGEYYHVDVTTDDGNVTNNGAAEIRPQNQISYVRFGLTTEEYKAIFPEGVTWNPRNDDAIPPCTAEKYQYYRYNSLLFDSYNREEVADALARSYIQISKEGNTLSEVKFSNRAAYNQALADVDYLVGVYFPKAGISLGENYIYNSDDRQFVLGIPTKA